MKKWVKNGVFASNTIKLNGCMVSNPTDLQLKAAGYKVYVEPIPSDEEKLEQAKQNKLSEIEAYDKSSSVNGFYLNGQLISWDSDDNSTLNKDVRMGFRQNIKDKISLGEKEIDMWLGGMKITLPCEQADALMCNLENYAYGCFNVTAAHKKAVSELTSIEEVEKFDVTADYPKQLEMTI